MTYTKQWLFNKSADKSLYQSSAMANKIKNLKDSGDIVSITIITVSPTQARLTMVFKDESVYNSWTSWIQSNEISSINNYHSDNNITVNLL